MYVSFLDSLLRDLAVSCKPLVAIFDKTFFLNCYLSPVDVEDIRRLSSSLTHIANEKQKAIKVLINHINYYSDQWVWSNINYSTDR